MRDVTAAKPKVTLAIPILLNASLLNSVWERRCVANSVCLRPQRNRVSRSLRSPTGVRERDGNDAPSQDQE
jgi:hypothetical protein